MPTAAMLQAMYAAPLGDDVFGEDPTVHALEVKLAAIFGMQAGIFCPSGTMTNQIAIKCHTNMGDEVICDSLSHIYQYEAGGIATNSLCSVKLINGNSGRITASQVVESIQPNDVHKPISKLVSLENTSNRGGGTCYQFSEMVAIKKVCEENNLLLHLDGARVYNAIVAKEENPANYGKVFDSISICLSKGLGAPVGSVLLGNHTFIQQARRVRKRMGGGMRQAGMLAAAGIYAINNHVSLLKTDHLHAQEIAAALLKKEFVTEILPVETNIVIANIGGKYTAATFVSYMAANGVHLLALTTTQIRFVLHLNITKEMVQHCIELIEKM